MPTRPRPALPTLLCAAALCLATAGRARADCGPVIAAFEKADASGRFAWYTVAAPDQPATGDPMMIRVGDAKYVPVSGSKFKGKYQQTGMLDGVLADTLRRRERDGKADCKPLPGRTVRGEAATGFTVTGSIAISNGDPASEDVWISRATGLPILQGMDSASRGGVVWVYGDKAAAPPPEKLL